jgi:phosphotransferase system HPr-like phosphotransfer protein
MNLEDILYAAREHAASLLNDVELASTREEHIRLTARANEAELLVSDLQALYISEVTDK